MHAEDLAQELEEVKQGADRNAEPGWALLPKTIFDSLGAYDKNTMRQYYVSDEYISSKQEGVQVGRNNEVVDILLEQDTISRLHARIFFRNGELFIEDLKSGNGISIGSVEIKPYNPVKIQDKTMILFGSFEVIFLRIT